MPLGEIAGELLGGALRGVGHALVEIFFEVLIKGTGCAVIRFFRPKTEPSETACTIVGLSVWIGLVAVGWLVYASAG